MSSHVLIGAGAALSLVMVVASLCLLHYTQRQERFVARVQLVQGLAPRDKQGGSSINLRQVVLSLMAVVGQAIMRSGILPARTLADLEQTLEASGLRGPQGLGVFIGAKLVLLIGLPTVAWLVSGDLPIAPPFQKFAPMIAAVVGLMAPDRVIAQARTSYIRRLEAGIPDTLDMLVICTQAGLGLGPAIVRVANELRGAYPEAAAELEKTATEMQLLSDSRVAISQMGSRTGIESLKRLSATLIQSLQYGTPLSDALRVLSAELRQQMLNRCEARAARLPVMMTLPTIAFIMPCVFMVAGGPAIIQLMKAFSH